LRHANVGGIKQGDAYGIDFPMLIFYRQEGAVLVHVIHSPGDRPIMGEAEQIGSLFPRSKSEVLENKNALYFLGKPGFWQLWKAFKQVATDYFICGMAAVVRHEIIP
jgi:hypothetical protein